MPKYKDDQCEGCGGIRVAKSFLCADCLVKACARERQKTHILQSIIDGRDLEIAQLNERLCGAVDYGFKKNQEFDLLLRSHKRLEDTLEEVRKDEKDGKAEDTEEG